MLLDRTAYCAKKSKIAIHSIYSLKIFTQFLVVAQHLSYKKLIKNIFLENLNYKKMIKVTKKFSTGDTTFYTEWTL